ncbi:MAG: 4-hydroxy-tetrahydrodipicolinate reductase [Gemmatimonadota bacterium]
MKIALVGYGRMGRAVEAQAEARGHDVVACLGREQLGEPAEEIARRMSDADVAIDFTVASLVPNVVRAAAVARTHLVTGTTGLEEDAYEAMRGVDGIGVVHGPNFSIGVHVFFRLARTAAGLIDAVGAYDTHVHEAHHRHKRDHPSGTAVRLAELLTEGLNAKARWEAGPPDGRADPEVLYVTSTRAGEIPGTHTVGFEGAHDRIELTHEARGRDGFAAGAVRAAEWIGGKTGTFTFTEVMDHILDAENGGAG